MPALRGLGISRGVYGPTSLLAPNNAGVILRAEFFGTPAPVTDSIYIGSRTRSQLYIGSRSNSELYIGTKSFPDS